MGLLRAAPALLEAGSDETLLQASAAGASRTPLSELRRQVLLFKLEVGIAYFAAGQDEPWSLKSVTAAEAPFQRP
eukprot:s315_g7.t1